MNAKTIILFAMLAALAAGCTNEARRADAYGHFEADEVRVSAQVGGLLLRFDLQEGATVAAGRLVALVDTMPAFLQKQQIEATMRALRGKLQDPEPEIAVLLEQQDVLERERARLQRLIAGNAATQKQLDDIEGQLRILERQVAAARARASQANRAILSELEPLRARLRQVEDQLLRSHVYNPVQGTVLVTLAAAGEVVAPGRPLYVVAPLDTLILRAWISEPQLAEVRPGQQVHVLIDGPQGSHLTYPGTISRIADQAEFTPKMVQTREERVHLVYAIEVRVPNDGRLKVGMPAEVWFEKPPAEEVSE